VLTLAAVEPKEPPGAMLRYDGRLTTPLNLPPYCKAFVAFLGVRGHNALLARNVGNRANRSD
jgi:hypothetical protein